MSIDLTTDPDLTSHRIDVTLDWFGSLPKNAHVAVAPDETGLSQAFASYQCVFRELVPLESERFKKAWSKLKDPAPRLSVHRGGRGGRGTVILADEVAQPLEGDEMSYAFGNRALKKVRSHLSVCCPYPLALGFYAVQFRSYAVEGKVLINFKINGSGASDASALPFLGPAVETQIQRDPRQGREEVTVEIGHEDSMLAPGGGVVFLWREERADAKAAR